MGAERTRAESVQVSSQTADAGEDLHRRNVEVRTFPSPGLNDGVDLIPGRLDDHIGSLDVKSLDVEIHRAPLGWLRPTPLRGMVDARAMMPAHNTAGTAMAW
jgi:hypothetical protein